MKSAKINWPEVAVGDFAEVVTGGTPSTAKSEYWKNGNIPWLNSGELNKRVITQADNFITEDGLRNSAARMMPKDTVLVALTGATTGVSALLKTSACANQSVTGILPSNRHHSHFLFHYMQSIRPRIVGDSYGGAQKHISQAYVKQLKVPLPPVEEQARIANLLDEADELRNLRTQADRRANALIPALFHEMFGDPEHTRLSVKPLIELVDEERPITYGILKPGPDVEGGIPYVRVLDIKQSRLHVEQLHKTTKEIANQYRRSTLRPGDILVTIRGSVGRTCIVPDELSGANITQDTARLATIPSIEPVYVVEFLNTPWAQSWMNHHTQGQAVKGINLGDLKKLPVPVPPIPLQKEFAVRVSEIRAVQAEQAVTRQRLEALFQSLLHRAFHGEL